MADNRPFAVQGLDHVVIRAKDIESMLGFYRDLLGLPVLKYNEPLGLWHLRAGDAMIDLVDMAGPLGEKGGPAPTESRNVDHVAIQIHPFDEAALKAFFGDQGVWTEDAARERFGAQGTGLSLNLKDPEGNGVELKAQA